MKLRELLNAKKVDRVPPGWMTREQLADAENDVMLGLLALRAKASDVLP